MKVTINDDFDLNKIINSGQCFRPHMIDEGVYVFTTAGHVLRIQATFNENEYEVDCTKNEWESVWHNYFDLDTNYAAIRALIPENDSFLKKSSELGKGIRILKQDKFEMLISFIISQRKSIPAIKSAVEKLCELYGTKKENIYLFPTPSQLSKATDEELKECGLGYRVEYVKAATNAVCSGEIDLEGLCNLDDTVLFEKLKEIKGVGDKVANCVMLFAYHRVARAPIDTWIKKVIKEVYNGENVFDKYVGVGGIMQQFAFYAAWHEKMLL